MNNKPNQNIIPSRGGALHEITLRAKLIFRLLADRRVSPWAKLVPIAGLIYWISPIDLISAPGGASSPNRRRRAAIRTVRPAKDSVPVAAGSMTNDFIVLLVSPCPEGRSMGESTACCGT